MREELPAALVRGLSGADRSKVVAWWRAVGPAERAAVRLVVKRSFRGLVGRFEDDPFVDDVPDEPDDLYEYLVNHELEYPKPPTLHVCTAEPAAREVVRRGRIPSDFQCPRGRRSCPMRRLIAVAAGSDIEVSFLEPSGGADG